MDEHDDLELEHARDRRARGLADVYLQDAGQILSQAKLEPDWLFEGAVPTGSIVFVVGKPGSCKSWLAYDAVCAVSQNRPWMNFGKPVGGRGPVLVMNYDNPAHECGRRHLRLGLTARSPAFFHSIGIHNPPAGLPAILQFPDAFEPIETLVQHIQPKLVVVDSLRQAQTGDESNSQEMARVMGQFRRLTSYGCTFVVVHHTRKTDGMMRGSTEIEASADAIIEISEGMATWRKTRGWDMLQSSVGFSLIDRGNSTVLEGGPTLLTVLMAERGPLSRRDIQERLGLNQTAAKTIVDNYLSRGLVVETRGIGGNRMIELVGGMARTE